MTYENRPLLDPVFIEARGVRGKFSFLINNETSEASLSVEPIATTDGTELTEAKVVAFGEAFEKLATTIYDFRAAEVERLNQQN